MDNVNIKYLKDENSKVISPITSADSVFVGGGVSLQNDLNSMSRIIDKQQFLHLTSNYPESIIIDLNKIKGNISDGTHFKLRIDLLFRITGAYNTSEVFNGYITFKDREPTTNSFTALQLSIDEQVHPLFRDNSRMCFRCYAGTICSLVSFMDIFLYNNSYNLLTYTNSNIRGAGLYIFDTLQIFDTTSINDIEIYVQNKTFGYYSLVVTQLF